ncbi:MAG: exodeoxyribonuclease VII large subunit, partial [Verrucomicrobia bacterium]|nr:exodeoxyribonuclease VII large subunit [Verrucomicrobiota bacterium]
IQDIITVLQRRHSGFHLILYPVKVQGEGAKEEISKAIADFNRYKLADVLIVGRGGGSLEDLWAFNEELVIEAIFRSAIPVISAVGHETDFSLSDFVADVRAPTPSAAAEIVLAEKNQQLTFLLKAKAQINQVTLGLVSSLKKQIFSLQKNPYLASPYLLLAKKIQELDDRKAQLNFSMTSILSQKKMKLLALDKQKKALEPSFQIQTAKKKLLVLSKAIETSLIQTLRLKKQHFDLPSMHKKLDFLLLSFLKKKKENLLKLTSHLTSIDPKNLLTKGYCILFSENKDSVILSSKQVCISQNLKVLLQDGIISTKVEKITYESN